jgi:hypothetical protein
MKAITNKKQVAMLHHDIKTRSAYFSQQLHQKDTYIRELEEVLAQVTGKKPPVYN